MTPEEYGLCFTLLDDYSRLMHKCLLTEFFWVEKQRLHYLCFRPLGLVPDSPNRYACKYVTLDSEKVRAITLARSLPASVTQAIDEAIPTMSKM
jgi:hypothetical protein